MKNVEITVGVFEGVEDTGKKNFVVKVYDSKGVLSYAFFDDYDDALAVADLVGETLTALTNGKRTKDFLERDTNEL